MNISRKTRYATRALIELAYISQKTDAPIQVQEISVSQKIPARYLENIFSTLVKAGILTGIKGKGGGFRLALPPEKIGLDMIVEILENPLNGIICLDNPRSCGEAEQCVTRKIWDDFSEHVRSFFHRITLADMLGSYKKNEYMYHI